MEIRIVLHILFWSRPKFEVSPDSTGPQFVTASNYVNKLNTVVNFSCRSDARPLIVGAMMMKPDAF